MMVSAKTIRRDRFLCQSLPEILTQHDDVLSPWMVCMIEGQATLACTCEAMVSFLEPVEDHAIERMRDGFETRPQIGEISRVLEAVAHRGI